MKAAVVGLGVEGKKATKSLISNGFEVYATDLNSEIDLGDLEIPLSKANFFTNNDAITISTDSLTIDIGYNDKKKIFCCDFVMLSPSMFNTKIAKDIIKSGKFISDILTKHKNTFTIGITGTNGKTTTILMLKEIFENSGKKVLVGGNAGGGFDGYCDIILKSQKEDYDILLIEVCDMTLKFCDYCFNFDLVGLTNIANDHIDVHGSIDNYKNSVVEFSQKKAMFLDKNTSFFNDFINISKISEVSNISESSSSSDVSNLSDVSNSFDFHENNYETKIFDYGEYFNDLNVFGKFNRLNAGLASSIAKYINIDTKIIKDTLKNFEAVEGRLKVYKLNDSKIFIGKTDNSHAVKSILDEQYFYACFIGTPRFNEDYRFDILNCVAKSNPEIIVLFPGLDDTLDHALYRLKSIGYEGRIEIANNLDEIIALVAEYSHEDAIFIGGNGQDTIIEIQKRLNLLSDICS